MKNLLVSILGKDYSKIGQINVGDHTWYKALDVCKVIGLKNTSLAVKGNLRIGYFGVEDEWCIIRSKLDTQSGLSWTPNPELTGQSIR